MQTYNSQVVGVQPTVLRVLRRVRRPERSDARSAGYQLVSACLVSLFNIDEQIHYDMGNYSGSSSVLINAVSSDPSMHHIFALISRIVTVNPRDSIATP